MSMSKKYSVQCDGCGIGDQLSWYYPDHADAFARAAGWDISGDDHLCPLCVEKKLQYTPNPN